MNCAICKINIPITEKSFDVHVTTTSYTNEIIIKFIEKAVKISLPDKQICIICYKLVNDWDYSLERCAEICRRLFGNYQKNNIEKSVLSENFNIKETNNIKKEELHDEHFLQENDSTFNCSFCMKNFKSENALKCHSERMHSLPDELSANLDDNKLNIPVLKPHQCNQCLKQWKTLRELKMHELSHSNEKPYVCEICGKAYKQKKALNIHLDMHKGINRFTCQYCNKSFTQKKGLERHIPIHTGKTAFQCDLCGKSFLYHTSFRSHLITHTGEKKFKCNRCNLAVSSASHLTRHMRIHTGERNFACQVCGRKFAERYNLISHQKLHNSTNDIKKRYSCVICGISFNKNLKLNEHLQNRHGKVPETCNENFEKE